MKAVTNTMGSHATPEFTTAPEIGGRVRCAIYARYSSDNQRQSSIEDQIRNCREAAARKGWLVVEEYIFSDSEKTGTTMHGRSGLQTLMALAKTKPKQIDYILVDDTSRFGRNKADSFKNLEILTFYDVHLYFVEDGLDSAEPCEARSKVLPHRPTESGTEAGMSCTRGETQNSSTSVFQPPNPECQGDVIGLSLDFETASIP